MLCKTILVDREDACRIKCEVIRLVESNTLRCTIDIHTLHRTVTLHDTLTSSIVGIAVDAVVVFQHHQAVLLLPV